MGRRMRRKSNNVRKRIMIKLLKLIVFLGLPLLVFVSMFRLEQVTVTGSQRYTQDAMKEKVIQTRYDQNTLLMYMRYSYFKEVDIPFVEKIDLKLVDSHTVAIHVYEKMVTGCVEFMGEYLYFDKDGIVVENSSTLLEDIPQIKGLRFKQIIMNEKLIVQKAELFDIILNLTQLIDKYGLDVSAIRFDSDYSVTVDCGIISASLGKRSTYDEVLYELSNIIQGTNTEINAVLERIEGDELELDMSKYSKDTKTIVAKPKKTAK